MVRVDVMAGVTLTSPARMVALDTNRTGGTPWRALIALFAVSLIWGATFVWMKDALDVAESRLGPGHRVSTLSLFLVLRFGSAALIVLALSRSARRGQNRAAWGGGLWLGGLLFAGFALQMIGLVEISPAVSAFLTSLYVLFTALIATVGQRRRLRVSLVIGALLATIGAGLIRGRPELGFTLGEWLTIGSALVFAVHILATDQVTRRVDPMPITFTSFAVVAVLSLALFGAAQASNDAPSFELIVELACDREFLVPLALTTVLATVVALTLMNLYQRELDPVRAAILYAFEPIWATIFGLSTGHDVLTPWLWIGGSALLVGNLVAELGVRRAEVST